MVERFEPADRGKYKSVKDLPADKQAGYVDIEGGFITKEAASAAEDLDFLDADLNLYDEKRRMNADYHEIKNFTVRSAVLNEFQISVEKSANLSNKHKFDKYHAQTEALTTRVEIKVILPLPLSTDSKLFKDAGIRSHSTQLFSRYLTNPEKPDIANAIRDIEQQYKMAVCWEANRPDFVSGEGRMLALAPRKSVAQKEYEMIKDLPLKQVYKQG